METNTEDPQMAIALTETENPIHIDSDSDDGILSSYSLPTFPELTRSSKEQQSLLTRSQYAMVVFHGVADTYPTDSDIVCRYSLTDGVEAAPGDRVVLFAVGWSSIKDYVVFEWAPIPEKDERDLTVVFKAADLPKDVNEFYQVCYVSNESAVCGASVPFQVRTPNNEELTFALEEDMVVVRSSTAVAQDKLLKAQLDRENLNKKKLNLEKQLRSLEDKHSLTLRRLDRLQETLSTSNALNEELKKENTRLLDLNEEMSCVKKELEEAQMKLVDAKLETQKMQKDVEAMVNAVQDRNRTLEVKVRELEDELSAATDHITTLKKEHGKFQDVIETAHGDLEQSELKAASLAKKNFALENELTVCKFNLNNAQVENLRLKKELEDLAKENEKLDRDLRNAKQSTEAHQSFYNQHESTDRGRLIMNNARLQKSTEDMQLTISALEHEKSTLEVVLEDMLDAQKNPCSDHCALEKRVAQLQYRLEEASSSNRVVEKKQSSSKTDQSSSLADQVETLSKLLDDLLKENEIRLQENMALRVQNEILETNISREKSASEEYVIVSSCDSSRPVQHTSTAENFQGNTHERNSELERMRGRLIAHQELVDDYVRRLAVKDEEIQKLNSSMDALKNESLAAEKELRLELSNLVTTNAILLEQEIRSQELKNEMQKITFMNEELLVQNASLMERIHDDKGKSSRNTDINTFQKTPDSQSLPTALETENERLREQLALTCEQLDKARKEEETAVTALREYRCFEKELAAFKEEDNRVKNRYSALHERSEILLRRMSRMASVVGEKCHHGCCADPRLEQISQSTEKLLSTWPKPGNSNEVKEDGQSTVVDSNELKYRLELAREEYEKLHTVMTTYRTKYNELKAKYMKSAGKRHHVGSCSKST